jgi:hypothetical protein
MRGSKYEERPACQVDEGSLFQGAKTLGETCVLTLLRHVAVAHDRLWIEVSGMENKLPSHVGCGTVFLDELQVTQLIKTLCITWNLDVYYQVQKSSSPDAILSHRGLNKPKF